MSDPTPLFRLSCCPGARAAAVVHEVAPGRNVLSAFVDPLNVVINVPPLPDGHLVMARFCRELARAAWKLAEELDPLPPAPPEAPMPSSRPRHAYRRTVEGDPS